jgi:hypothetical protein
VVAGEGLRSVGAASTSPIQERLLYPAPRSTFAGRGNRQWGTAPARGSPLLSSATLVLPIVPGAAFALPSPDAAMPACADKGDVRIHPAAFEQVLERFQESKLSDL